MGELRILNVKIRSAQYDNLRKLAALKKTSIAEVVRLIFDEMLGTVDAASLIFRHADGKEEQL